LHDVVLRVSDLRVETSRGREIIEVESLEISRSSVLGVVGESGSGKTTLALALLGHARPGTRIARGQVLLHGTRDLLQSGRGAIEKIRGGEVSYVPQDPGSALSPRHRVGRQIEEALKTHGRGEGSAAVVRELCARVGLANDSEFLRRYPFELSGGQQQRIAIAMALACGPSVIIMDEPTTGLDATTQRRILALVASLAEEESAGFVYISHDLAVVRELAAEIAVMYAGQIVEQGATEDVFREPRHPYTSLLLNSVPRLRRRTVMQGIPGQAPAPGQRESGCRFVPRCPLAIDDCRSPAATVLQESGGRSVRCIRAGDASRLLRVVEAEAIAASEDAAPVLEVRDLVASYGRASRANVVVHGVSIAIGAGECVALVGESGSGKSTFGRAVAGLHPWDSGEVRLFGTSLAPRSRSREKSSLRSVQIVFQNPDRSLNPAHRVREIVERPIRLFESHDDAVVDARLLETADQASLSPALLNRYPRELSGGEKQRVAIARALAATPDLIICDEITSSLDVSIQATIMAILRRLLDDGLSLLFITHNLALVNNFAHSVVVMEHGRLVESGATFDVIQQPRQAYTQELVAAAPDLPGDTLAAVQGGQ
jgi:peptide/nickel transport system ATP-binding protein